MLILTFLIKGSKITLTHCMKIKRLYKQTKNGLKYMELKSYMSGQKTD